MYYYALIKQTNFNPEEQLRLKAYWEKWDDKFESKQSNISCLWWYGINKEFIRKAVLEGESRGNQIRKFLVPMLIKKDDNNTYVVDKLEREKIDKALKKRMHDKRIIEILGRKVKIEIKEA